MSAKSALAITLLNANATFSISYESWDSNGIDLITLRLKLTEKAAEEEQK